MALSITFVTIATIAMVIIAAYMTFNEDAVVDKIINFFNRK